MKQTKVVKLSYFKAGQSKLFYFKAGQSNLGEREEYFFVFIIEHSGSALTVYLQCTYSEGSLGLYTAPQSTNILLQMKQG